MARATSKPTTKLSQLFTDPFLRDAFWRAERDHGGASAPLGVVADRPLTLNGGAASQTAEIARILEAMEAVGLDPATITKNFELEQAAVGRPRTLDGGEASSIIEREMTDA